MKKLHCFALLALAGVGFTAQTANAVQPTTTWNPGDLLLGFYSTGSGTTGSTSNILIDLGPAYQYADRNPTVMGSQTSIIGINLGSLLNSTYETGGSWSTDPLLRWGLVGWSGTANPTLNGIREFANTLYISNPETNPNPPVADPSFQSAAGNDINTMTTQGSNVFVGQTINNGLLNGSLYGTSGDSWAAHAANSFGDAAQFGQFQTAPTLTSALDLYHLTPPISGHTSTRDGLDGTFTINSSGQVFYSAPTPEPTSVALLGGAGLLFLARSRRRAAQA